MSTAKDRIFCELALRSEAIAEEKLRQGLTSQKEMDQFGISKFIGAILVEKSLASREDVSAVLEVIERHDVRCPECSRMCPAEQTDRSGNLKCPSCQQIINVPEGRISPDTLVETEAVGRKARKKRSEEPAAGPSRAPDAPHDAAGRADRTGMPEDNAERAASNRASPKGADPFAQRRFESAYPEGIPQALDVQRYHVKALVGISSTGRLYRIQERSRFGALKVIDSALCQNRIAFKNWVDYMQQVQDVPRSATLKPVQLMRDGGLNYVVRPYVYPADNSLKEWLATHGSAGLREIVDLALAILNSLAVFHSTRIVHGNLKPENVLCSEDAVQLTDPGVLLLYEGLDASERLLRLADSERYHAPEVLQGGEPTFTSDVFSAGRVIEDILASQPADAVPANADANVAEETRAAHTRLECLAEKMTRLDPSERPTSAKEAIRELERGDRPLPKSSRREAEGKRRRPRIRGREWLHKTMRAGAASWIVLAAVVAGLTLQSWSWFRVRKAIATTTHSSELSRKLVTEEIDTLLQWMRDKHAGGEEAQSRWNELAEMLRGSPWESVVLAKAERAMADLGGSCSETARVSLDLAANLAAKKDWVESLEAVLNHVDELERSPRWRELRETILTGLHRDLGLLFIPAGDVVARSGSKSRAVHVDAFLVSATPVEKPPGKPLTGVSFIEARKLARAQDKALPSLALWLRMAEAVQTNDAWGRFLTARIRGLHGPRFEWVEDLMQDNLSRAGCGTCVGGDRPGVPPTQPLRRWRSYGYPDVGFRLVVPLHPPKESSSRLRS